MSSLQTLFGQNASVLREREFQLLLLANVVPVTGTAMLSPILESLIGPFGTTPTNIGLMISFYTAPPILLIPIIGTIADSYGRKTVLVPSLLLFGAAGSAIALTTDFRVVLGLRFLQGIGYAGCLPIIITLLGDRYSDAREVTAQGVRFMTTGISQALIPLLAGAIVGLAWQYPFLLQAIAIPIALLVLVGFDEPPASDSGTEPSVSYRRALLGLVTQRRVFAFVVARSIGVVVWIGFFTYNSIIVVRLLGGTPAIAGVVTALAAATMAVAASQAGRLTGLFAGQYRLLGLANLAMGVGFAALFIAPNVPTATASIVVSSAGFGILLSLYRSIINGLAPRSLRGGIVSIAEAGGRLVATLTPLAMGATIAIGGPEIGFNAAVRLGGFGLAVVGAGGGFICLGIAYLAPEVVTDAEPTIG